MSHQNPFYKTIRESVIRESRLVNGRGSPRVAVVLRDGGQELAASLSESMGDKAMFLIEGDEAPGANIEHLIVVGETSDFSLLWLGHLTGSFVPGSPAELGHWTEIAKR